MLSKIKSPSLVGGERRSPLIGHNHHLQAVRSANRAATSSASESNSEGPMLLHEISSDRDDDLEVENEEVENELVERQTCDDVEEQMAVKKANQEEDLDSQTDEAADLVIDQPRSPGEANNNVDGDEDAARQDDENNNNNNNNNDDQINNNNNNNNDLIEGQINQTQQGKKTQNELLGIIELSRKRRLSKDSADSLTSFIRWSFSHFDVSSMSYKQSAPMRQLVERITRDSETEDLDRELDSQELEQKQQTERTTTTTLLDIKDETQHQQQQQQRCAELAALREAMKDETNSAKSLAEIEADRAIKYTTERVLRNRAAKLSSSSSNGQLNLTVARALERHQMKQQQHQHQQRADLSPSSPVKRSRMAIANSYSPEPASKHFNSSPSSATSTTTPTDLQNGSSPSRKLAGLNQLGNVVDRLHAQQRHEVLGASMRNNNNNNNGRNFGANDELDMDQDDAANTNSGLSLQLQQFLQQQQQQQQHQLQQQRQSNSSKQFADDLSLGLDDNLTTGGAGGGQQQQHQLALAAAIHRALMNNGGGGGGGGGQDLQKTAAALLSGSHSNHTNTSPGAGSVNGNSAFASSLVDSLSRRQQQQQVAPASQHQHQQLSRPYNTRGHAGGLAHAAANLASSRLQQHHHQHLHHHPPQQQQQVGTHHHNHLAGGPLNGSAVGGQRALVMQQQQARHAQAAAALSALANGAHPAAALHHFAAAAAAAAAVGGPPGAAGGALAHSPLAVSSAALLQQQHHHLNQHQQQQRHQLASAGIPLSAALNNQTDFKCDTCPSSFDDRHRLMQHQSIHLELKKDWFTETPVEEVMRIFNRRRGEFLCNMCNLRFEATLDYDQHNHTVHGPRPYCCQFCGNGTRTFKCWRQYLNHLYDHRYIFSCTIGDCDFTVNRRDSLRFHIFRFHLNCQLPQNMAAGQKIQTSPFNLSQSTGGGGGGTFNLAGGNPQDWPSHLDDQDHHLDDDDDGDDTENEMNVAD